MMMMRALSQSRRILLFLTVLPCITSALGFLEPSLEVVSGNALLPEFEAGRNISIAWTTQWQFTNLIVFQLLPGGLSFTYEGLAVHNNQSNTTFEWEAGALDNLPLGSTNPFHFQLQNYDSQDCDTCVLNGPSFVVRQRVETTSQASAATSPSSPTGTAPASSTPTGSGEGAAAKGGSNEEETSDSKSKSKDDLGVPLGIGLGLGIPAVFILCVLLWLFLRSRRKDKNKDVEYESEKRISPDYSTPPSYTRDAEEKDMRRENRESGTLGPWALLQPPPNSNRSSQNSSRYHSSWRPSVPAMDEESEGDTSRHSRASLMEFDFETQGSQSHDEMSQLHESIAELPGSELRPPDGDNADLESSGVSHYSSAVSNFLDDASDTTEPANSEWPLRS